MSEAASGDPTITVEIVDDHFLFAQALGAVVGEQPGWTVVGLAVTGPQALGIAKEQQPRVILLDYHLPGVNADVLVPRLRLLAPSAKIIVLTGDTSEAARRNAEAAGANGFLTKDTAIEDVIEMIQALLRDANDKGRPQLAAPSPPISETALPLPLPATAPLSREEEFTAARSVDPSTAWADSSRDGATESFMDAIGSLLLAAADATPAPTVEAQADNSAATADPLQPRGGAPVEARVRPTTAAAGAPAEGELSERTPTERGDELWSGHLAALARLARAEALAVALWRDAALEPFVAWGLPPGHDRDWLEGPVGAAANAAFLRRALQHQPRVSVLLADGRIASAALASPVTVRNTAVGVVVALRAGEVFTRADAAPIAAVAEAVATALTDAGALHHAEQERAEAHVRATQEEERTHALALNEVARALADSDNSGSGMGRAAIVISGTLDTDLVGIWLSEPDGRLRCAAAHGYLVTPPPVRIDTDSVLVRVALGQRTETIHYGSADGPLWTGGATDLLLAPIAAAGIVRGVLIEGRRGRGFGAAEVQLAPRLAATLGSLGTTAAVSLPATPVTPGAAPLVAPVAAPLVAPLVAPVAAPLVAPVAAPVAAPPESKAPQQARKGRGAFALTVAALVLAVAAAAAGLAGLGPAAYLAAAALLLVALLSFHG